MTLQIKEITKQPFGFWEKRVVVQRNNFVNKSLSSWSCNTAVGCLHGCRFCYVPETSTTKQEDKLAEYGVGDPDADWGQYALLRPWDSKEFLNSVNRAQMTPMSQLNADGNRAVMFSTTTDPYQFFTSKQSPDYARFNRQAEFVMRNALVTIRDESDLNVRILTRSGVAVNHFDLFKTLGNRLVFGMSLPTLNDKLRELYEPNAPGIAQRLRTLQKAKDAGLHVTLPLRLPIPSATRKTFGQRWRQ